MPANERSFRLTNVYRQRLDAVRIRVQRDIERRWRALMPQDLDGDQWATSTASLVAQAQTEAVRVTQGYLAAFLTLELGHRTQPPTLTVGDYAGRSRDGRQLAEALQSPIIGTKAALKEGKPTVEALGVGLDRANRMVELDTLHAARTALLDAIDRDDRFDGWQRVTTGTCGACAAVAGRHERGLLFQVHPSCKCVSQPVVSGVPNRVAVPTGAVLFAAKSKEQQDEMLGPEAAELVRTGEIGIEQLAGESTLDSDQESFLTQKPIEALK